MSEPLGDLVAAEGELARAVSEVEDGERVFGGDFAGNGEGAETGSGDGTTGFVAVTMLEQNGGNHAETGLAERAIPLALLPAIEACRQFCGCGLAAH